MAKFMYTLIIDDQGHSSMEAVTDDLYTLLRHVVDGVLGDPDRPLAGCTIAAQKPMYELHELELIEPWKGQ